MKKRLSSFSAGHELTLQHLGFPYSRPDKLAGCQNHGPCLGALSIRVPGPSHSWVPKTDPKP